MIKYIVKSVTKFRISSLAIFGLLVSLVQASLDTVSLQLNWKHQYQFAGYYAAQQKGFYEKEGLAVVFRELGAGEDAVDNVIFGKAEYGIQGSDILKAWSDGKPVVSLAVIFQTSPFILITKPHITIPSQLNGQRVDIGQPESLELQALLSLGGAKLDSIQLVRSTDGINAFRKNKVVAFKGFITNEPEMLWVEKQEFNIIRPDRYGISAYGDCIFTTRSNLQSDPEQVMRFVRATLEGWKYALAHRDEMVEFIHKHYAPNLSIEHLRFEAEAYEDMFDSTRVAIGSQSVGFWEQDAAFFQKAGVLGPIDDIGSRVYDIERIDREHKTSILKWVTYVAGIAFVLALIFSVFTWLLWRGMTKRNQELAQSELRLQQALKATSDAVWSWPKLDEPMWWSKLAYEMMGLDAKTFVPTWGAFIEQVHPDDRESFERSLLNALDSSSMYARDFRILNGEIGGHWIRMRAIANHQLNATGFSGLFQDIHQLKTAEAALRDSEARFRQYFELGLVGMATVSADGAFLQINRTFCEMLETTESEILKLDWKGFTHPGDLSLEEDLMDSVARGERQGFTIDKRYLTKNKRIVYALVAVRAILDSKGDVGNWVMLVQDISQRRHGEQEKERILHQLSLKNRTLEGMLHTISHDFRHPLVNVMWYSQELERSVADFVQNSSQEGGSAVLQEELRYSLKEIRNGAQVLDRMLTGILALSRLGRQPPEFVHVEMKQVIQALVDEFKQQLEDAHAQIEIEALPCCLGSESMLYQVWKHLLQNAIQNRDSSRPLRLRVAGSIVREWVVYTIDDNGIGIPASSLAHIFAPFFRLNPSTGHQGEGLGLTFVTRILESHRGHVKVESELGKGSRFSVYLPKSTQA